LASLLHDLQTPEIDDFSDNITKSITLIIYKILPTIASPQGIPVSLATEVSCDGTLVRMVSVEGPLREGVWAGTLPSFTYSISKRLQQQKKPIGPHKQAFQTPKPL
jgi:hypothetical protein